MPWGRAHPKGLSFPLIGRDGLNLPATRTAGARGWQRRLPGPCFLKLRRRRRPGTHPPCSQYECTHSRLVLSHSLTVLSSLADTMSRPSGENLSQTRQVTPQAELSRAPHPTSHSHPPALPPPDPRNQQATRLALTPVTLGRGCPSVRWGRHRRAGPARGGEGRCAQGLPVLSVLRWPKARVVPGPSL